MFRICSRSSWQKSSLERISLESSPFLRELGSATPRYRSWYIVSHVIWLQHVKVMSNDEDGGTTVGTVYRTISVRKRKTSCHILANTLLESRLGITIEPSQVRLIPRTDDLYCWKVLSEKQYLFSKNLSEHSTGAYKELWSGVGVTFEAVPKTHDVMVSLNVPGVWSRNRIFLTSYSQ
jgi:hypothetical protein